MLKNVVDLGDDTTDILDGVELRVVESASKVSNMVVRARSLRCSWSKASSVGFDYWFSGVVGRQAIVGLSLEGFRRLRGEKKEKKRKKRPFTFGKSENDLS